MASGYQELGPEDLSYVLPVQGVAEHLGTNGLQKLVYISVPENHGTSMYIKGQPAGDQLERFDVIHTGSTGELYNPDPLPRVKEQKYTFPDHGELFKSKPMPDVAYAEGHELEAPRIEHLPTNPQAETHNQQ